MVVLRDAAAEYEDVVRLEPENAGALRELAEVYGRLAEHAEAIRIWKLYLEIDPGSFDGFLKLGTHNLALGEPQQAIPALQSAVGLRPSSPGAHQGLGDAFARAEQPAEAVTAYQRALELEPGSVITRIKLGETLLRSERLDEALAEAETILVEDERNRYGLELKARGLRDQRQLESADAAADRLLALYPNDVKHSYLKVTIAEARRDFGTVAELLVALLARDKSDEDPADAVRNDRAFLVHLGFARQQLGQHELAVEAFSRAKQVGEKPGAELLGYLVEANRLAGNHDAALAEVQAARARFPDVPALAGLQASVLDALGRAQEARQVVEDLERDSPGDTDVLLEVASFYQRGKEFEEAERVLRQAREIESSNLRTLFQLGAVLERQKRHDEAEALFREALEVEPDSAPILNYLGYMNADRGVRLDEALALIERAVALDPENGAYLDSLGWALYRLNRLEQAESHLRRALTKEGQNAVILSHLGDILHRRGDVREAVEYWRKALGGEDEDEELDRDTVELKIREAESHLDGPRQEF